MAQNLTRPSRRHGRHLLLIIVAALLVAAAIVLIGRSAAAAEAAAAEAAAGKSAVVGRALVIPVIDPAEGRRLFVAKGCVVCHAVNGTGGKAGPALDLPPGQRYADVFAFAARMWRGSFAMIQLQAMELGYQIELSGDEMAHIFGFVHDPAEQARFGDSDIPDLIRDWMVDERYDELERRLEGEDD